MKLIAVKCPNCGAKIKVNREDKIYTCNYCRYDLFLDSGESREPFNLEDAQAILKLPTEKALKTFLIIKVAFVAIFFLIMAIVLFGMFNIFNSRGVGSYNMFIDDIGVVNYSRTSSLLTEVANTMTESEEIITVTFDGDDITNIDEITALSNQIKDSTMLYIPEYRISNEMDEDGRINRIIIESLPPNPEDFNNSIDDIGNMSGVFVSLLIEDVIDINTQTNREVVIILNGTAHKTMEELQNAVLIVDQPFTDYAVTNERDAEGYIIKITITSI